MENEANSNFNADSVDLASKRLNISISPSLEITNIILNHHKQMQSLKWKIKEILETQEECFMKAFNENKRYKEVNTSFDFNVMFKQVAVYTKKLVNIHYDMIMCQDRMQRLKLRAKAIKEHQEVKVREIQEAKALHEERERLLTAKPVWQMSPANISDLS